MTPVICPIVGRSTSIPFGNAWECSEHSCRFRIDGVCAIIGAFAESKDNRRLLNAIAQKIGVI